MYRYRCSGLAGGYKRGFLAGQNFTTEGTEVMELGAQRREDKALRTEVQQYCASLRLRAALAEPVAPWEDQKSM